MSHVSNGFKWFLYPDDSITRHILSGKLWEPHLLKFMKMWLKPNMNCIDIGACFGWHTLEMSRCTSNGVVVAFEPYKPAFELLEENVKENNIHNVICINKSVGKEEKKGYLCNAYDKFMNIGDSFIYDSYSPERSIHKDGKELTLNTQETECIRLDNFRFPFSIEFIKIDVQGYELFSLQGGEQLLKKYKPVIAIEVEEPCMVPNNYTAKELFEYIFTLDYEIFYLEANYPCDHICVHREKMGDFLTIFGEYIKDHRENNGISNNFKNGVRKKISLQF